MFDDGWAVGARRVAAGVAAALPGAAVADRSDDAVLDAIAGLELARRLLDAAQLEHIAELSRRAHARRPMFEDADDPEHGGVLPGRPRRGEFVAEAVAVALGIGPTAAMRRVALAHGLEQRLPVVFDALAAGRVDLPRARLICEHTAALPEAAAQSVAAAVLADLPGLSWTGLENRLKAAAMAADPPTAAERARRARQNRVAWRTRVEDATIGLGARLPVVDAALAWDGLTHAAQAMQTLARQAGEPLTLDQARADALAAALAGLAGLGDPTATAAADPSAHAGATRAQPGPGTCGSRCPVSSRCLVSLTLPLATLLGQAAGPGEVNREPIDADTARRAALALLGDGAALRFVALNQDGTAAAVTAASRRVPARIADLVAARDRTCRFPLCTRTAQSCDVDHTDPAPYGATALANLAALCRRHHRLKTHTAWLLKQTDPGVLVWTTPAGRQITTEPGRWPSAAPPSTQRDEPQTHAECTDTLWAAVLAQTAQTAAGPPPADPPQPPADPPQPFAHPPDTREPDPWDAPPWERDQTSDP